MKGKGSNHSSMIRITVYGILTAVVTCVTLAMVLSSLVINQKVGENRMEIVGAIILFISTCIGCMITKLPSGEIPLFVPISVAAVFLSVLLCAGMLLFEGTFESVPLSFAAVGAGCLLSCVLKPRKRKVKRSNFRYTG